MGERIEEEEQEGRERDEAANENPRKRRWGDTPSGYMDE